MFVFDFSGVARQHLKFHRQQLQEFRAPGRSRSENERRQFHDSMLPESIQLSSTAEIFSVGFAQINWTARAKWNKSADRRSYLWTKLYLRTW
jgi:hypothetical protein